MGSDPWSQQQINLVRQWLEDCDSKHTICPKIEPRPLPTRIIDVGGHDGDIRLRLGKDEVAAKYIALSHCWGGHTPVQTTKATLNPHFKTIPLNASSQTFLDAAQVCRDLGIHYLWIDSLCIVQDDEDDWTAEARQMAKVYQNASLTISAEAARNAKEGLFKNHRSVAQRQVNIDWITSAGAKVQVHVRERATTRAQGDPKTVGNFAHAITVPSSSKLASRAWVLQERLLSRRILHFFAEELAWSCCSVSRCECRLDADITDTSVFKRINDESSSRPRLVEELHREWSNLVVEFTHRNLTKPKDRLPAIAGLAKLCGQVAASSYHAGLFEHDMAHALLWRSNHSGPWLIRRNTDREQIPTWSWASTTGPVLYFPRQRNQFERRSNCLATVEPLLQILKTSVKLRGPDVYSDAESGRIVVKGQVIRVRYESETGNLRPWDDELADQRIKEDIEFEPQEHTWSAAETRAMAAKAMPGSPTPTEGKIIDLPKKAKTRAPGVILDVLFELRETSQSQNLYLLRAARLIGAGMYVYESSENLCLLLEKVVDGREAVYKRRALVLCGFPTKSFWSEENAPTEVVGII